MTGLGRKHWQWATSLFYCSAFSLEILIVRLCVFIASIRFRPVIEPPPPPPPPPAPLEHLHWGDWRFRSTWKVLKDKSSAHQKQRKEREEEFKRCKQNASTTERTGLLRRNRTFAHQPSSFLSTIRPKWNLPLVCSASSTDQHTSWGSLLSLSVQSPHTPGLLLSFHNETTDIRSSASSFRSTRLVGFLLIAYSAGKLQRLQRPLKPRLSPMRSTCGRSLKLLPCLSWMMGLKVGLKCVGGR